MSRREQSYFDKLKKANAKSSKLPNLPKIQSRLGSRGGEFDKNKVDKAWSQALKSCQLQKYVERKNATVKPVTKCWKTIRLFVSSTFSDFQFERDLLIKKVFPDLRAWCKERKLHLVEIDLRWGVPSGADAEWAVQTCFGEIDRCYKENTFPFFLSMVSERVGWIPAEGNGLTETIRSSFDWIDNLSITEMEGVHGAFRCQNPNALFLLRNPSFLQSIPSDMKSSFADQNLISAYKASKFRDHVEERFPDAQKVLYYASYTGKTNESGVPLLTGFESLLVEKVLRFFKSRIEHQYPSVSQEKVNKWQVLKELHEVFKDDEASMIGDLPVWNQQIDDLRAYMKLEDDKSPYMLSAVSGSGKSSCLATFLNRIHEDLPDFNIFFHFVGAVPGSVSYAQMIKRIAVFLGLDENRTVSSVVGSIKSHLSSTADKTLIVIDAYNQLDELSLTWLPCPLQANVNVIITGREDVVKHLQKNYSRELYVNKLKKMTEDDRKKLVQSFLGKFNKTLDNEQLESLISKQSSSSFYWLYLACEELRIFGHFSLLTDKIVSLPDDLVELQCQILRRLEADLDNRSWLLVAALCLLFTSRTGLLEDELLQILAEPPNILPIHLRDERFPEKLALKKWKEIQRVIRPFVKYNGDTAENRLNIYHQTFNEAIKKIYFSENPSTYNWFHEKLHVYFENCLRLDRKLEEYPFHLAFCNETEKLTSFLCQREVIANYYDPNFSKELTQLWSSVDKDFSVMAQSYILLANEISEDSELHLDERIREILILADICFQNGKFQEVLQIVDVVEQRLDLINDEDQQKRMRALVLYQKAKTTERKIFLPKKNSSETVDEIIEIEKILINSYNLLKDELSDSDLIGACADMCNRLAMLFYRKGRKHSKDNEILFEKNLTEACIWLDKGEEAFMRCDDFIGYANCQTSRAICERDFSKKRISFVAAEKILGGGGLHPTYGRFCRNKGRFHQLLGENELAKKYLDNFHHNSVSLYGQKHPETLRALQLLEELDG